MRTVSCSCIFCYVRALTRQWHGFCSSHLQFRGFGKRHLDLAPGQRHSYKAHFAQSGRVNCMQSMMSYMMQRRLLLSWGTSVPILPARRQSQGVAGRSFWRWSASLIQSAGGPACLGRAVCSSRVEALVFRSWARSRVRQQGCLWVLLVLIVLIYLRTLLLLIKTVSK